MKSPHHWSVEAEQPLIILRPLPGPRRTHCRSDSGLTPSSLAHRTDRPTGGPHRFHGVPHELLRIPGNTHLDTSFTDPTIRSSRDVRKRGQTPHGCYSVGDDRLWGVNRRKKGAANTLAALKSIRSARPDGAPIYVIMDNLSAHKGADIRRWAKKHKVELCFTPTYASWANPIEAHFGPLRQFTIANSNHPNHTVQTRALHAYLRWRNANARHHDVLAAERKERARIRSEKGIRWGGRPLTTAA